jgi:hypothetical protein
MMKIDEATSVKITTIASHSAGYCFMLFVTELPLIYRDIISAKLERLSNLSCSSF